MATKGQPMFAEISQMGWNPAQLPSVTAGIKSSAGRIESFVLESVNDLEAVYRGRLSGTKLTVYLETLLDD